MQALLRRSFLRQSRRALDDAGYRDWLGIEGTKLPLGVEQSVRYDLDYLRPLFPARL